MKLREWLFACIFTAALSFLFGYISIYHMMYEVEGVDQHGAIFVFAFFSGMMMALFGVFVSRDIEKDGEG